MALSFCRATTDILSAMEVDPRKVAEIIAETGEDVVMPRFQALAGGDVRRKASGELVTVADVETEQALTRRLCEVLPGAQFVGEEAAAEDPAILDRLEGDAPVWVIDPIDGTGNFARGKPVFAIMVALVQAGRTEAAWIHDPVGRQTAHALRGQGAWLDGKPLRVARVDANPSEMSGTLHASQFATKDVARQIEKRRDRVGAIKSMACAGHEYLRLARGDMAFSLFTKLMPWDHAPGGLIHAEAGGIGRLVDDGRAYTPAMHEARGLLLAPSEESWRALKETLFD